jgi:hypothetical protein
MADVNAPWYFGKKFNDRFRPERAAQIASGEFQRSRRPLLRLRNAVVHKRELRTRDPALSTKRVGSLHLAVLGGSFSTTRPYCVAELCGNERRTATAKSSQPRWGKGEVNEEASFELPVFDFSTSLCLFLFDDVSVRNETCVGRVIIPMTSLCENGLAPRPRHRQWFSIVPPSRQHSTTANGQFEEAVPGVPGSGMVKPAESLGAVELELQLTLSAKIPAALAGLTAAAPVLAAIFAMAASGREHAAEEGEDERAGDSSDGEDEGAGGGACGGGGGSTGAAQPAQPAQQPEREKLEPRVLRQNIRRIRRCLKPPALLTGKTAALLPVVRYDEEGAIMMRVLHVLWRDYW